MKILVAEDDATSRAILESMLTKWAYEVVTARDGEEAWAMLQAEGAPRLAILDWIMPGLEGIEICRRARQMGACQPLHIILLTAMEQKEDIVAGLEAGADDYITKPFDISELQARVRAGQRIVELQAALQNQVAELQEALTHVRTLQGILPICMHCHMIRDDQESWQRIENYLEAHSEAQFSHGLCPACRDKYYPEFNETDSPS
ncbi:MAG: response regulator transcription factor [Candidatus Hydrogenedentes bacterium]|nr:response regulator transcription factor [Candidatus Hydrogenedentota bacterium]